MLLTLLGGIPYKSQGFGGFEVPLDAGTGVYTTFCTPAELVVNQPLPMTWWVFNQFVDFFNFGVKLILPYGNS